MVVDTSSEITTKDLEEKKVEEEAKNGRAASGNENGEQGPIVGRGRREEDREEREGDEDEGPMVKCVVEDDGDGDDTDTKKQNTKGES